MAADLNKPITTDVYTQILADIRDMQLALAKMNHASTANLPTGAIQWSDTNIRLEKWNGTAWVALMPDATTSAKGLTQLSTSTASTSTTLAATASAVKSVKDSVNNLNFTNIAGTTTAGQVPNLQALSGACTAGQVPNIENLNGACTAGQVPDIEDLNGSFANLFPSAPYGHIKIGNIAIVDGVTNFGSSRSISMTNIDATVRTVGKTGSGADIIWSRLDGLPSSARALICNVRGEGTNSTGSDIDFLAHFGSGTGTITNSTSARVLNIRIHAGTTNKLERFAIIPLNATQQFQYFTSGYTNLTSKILEVTYQGYITD